MNVYKFFFKYHLNTILTEFDISRDDHSNEVLKKISQNLRNKEISFSLKFYKRPFITMFKAIKFCWKSSIVTI